MEGNLFVIFLDILVIIIYVDLIEIKVNKEGKEIYFWWGKKVLIVLLIVLDYNYFIVLGDI